MKNIRKKLLNNKNGSILVGSLLVMTLLMGLAASLITLVVSASISTQRSYQNIVATSQAEAAIEKTMWELNNGESISCPTLCVFDDAEVIMQTTDIDSENKEILAEAYVPTISNYKVKKTIKVNINAAPNTQGIAFNYALQTGDYGLTMYSNSKVVDGSVYTNGDIVGYSNSRIYNDAYAVGTISSPEPRIDGNSYPGSPPQEFPDVDVNFWKNQANKNNDPYIGNYTINNGAETLGPKKIDGNFTMNSNSDLTLTGPLHVTGDFELNSNTEIFLDEAFEDSGTVIIVDGIIRFNSNARIRDGSGDGYLLFVSTSTEYVGIELNSNSEGGVYYTDGSRIQMNSNAEVHAVIGRGLILNSNAEIDYEEGLASVEFSGGPGGSWDASSWQKVKN